jgi:hypothetical protein
MPDKAREKAGVERGVHVERYRVVVSRPAVP